MRTLAGGGNVAMPLVPHEVAAKRATRKERAKERISRATNWYPKLLMVVSFAMLSTRRDAKDVVGVFMLAGSKVVFSLIRPGNMTSMLVG